MSTETLLTTKELAIRIGVDPSTIRRWRTAQPAQGPAFIRVSERVTKYQIEDVEAWLKNRRVDPEMGRDG